MKKEIESYLHEHIPISQAMGISVEEASLEKIVLLAPFSNNINHKKTVFGGSLHAVATLACWSLLHVNLKKAKEADVQIVITKSEVSYQSPVDEDFRAECLMPEKETWNRFLKMLKLKGKSRIELSATIHNKGHLSVSYQGTFAAINPAKITKE